MTPNLTQNLVQNAPPPLRSAKDITAARGNARAAGQARPRMSTPTPPPPAIPAQHSVPLPRPAPLPEVSISETVLAAKFSARLAEADELGVIKDAVSDCIKAQQAGEQSSISIVSVQISALRSKLPFDKTGETDRELSRLRALDANELTLVRQRHWQERDEIASTRLAPVASMVFARVSALVKSKADVLDSAERDVADTFDIAFVGSGMLGDLRRVQSEYEALSGQAARGFVDFRQPLLTALLEAAPPN